jgi:osmotically inducible protein OsmC
MKSKATARWTGTMTEGRGTMSAASGAFKDLSYSIKSRFEGGVPGTTPEEMIAAAHAGCFIMQFGVFMMGEKIAPRVLEADAEVTIERSDAGANITTSALRCKVEVPGGDATKIRELGEKAKTGCPVSKALASVKVTLALDVKT